MLQYELISEVRGVPLKPSARCPNCTYQLQVVEILQGFTQDPQDVTTACPRCKTRFTAVLLERGQWSDYLELPFYCAIQTLDMLRGKGHLSPDALQKKHPAMYYSAVTHFGSIVQAFVRAGILYAYEDTVDDWKRKVVPYLGKLPDTVIASCVNVHVWSIRALRTKLGVGRYRAEAVE